MVADEAEGVELSGWRKQLAPFERLLGKVDDRVLADLAGVGINAVRTRRRALNIDEFGSDAALREEQEREHDREVRDHVEARKRRANSKARAARETAEQVAIALVEEDLGKVPDSVLADRAGLSVAAVRRYRRKRLIAAPATPPLLPGRKPHRDDWRIDPYSDIAGRVSDRDLAKRVGLRADVVRRYREARGIGLRRQNTQPKPQLTVPAAQQADVALGPFRELLGVEPDRVIAELAGIPKPWVSLYRKRHGLPGRPRGRPRTKTPPVDPIDQLRREDAVDILGVLPDMEVARRANVGVSIVARWRRELGIARPPARSSKIDAVRHLVGTVPDAEVARLAGVQTSAVHSYRMRKGIPLAGADDHQRAAREEILARLRGELREQESLADDHGNDRRSKVEAVEHLLGTVPDTYIATIAGVSVSAVARWRTKRGIPPALPGRGRPRKSGGAGAGSADEQDPALTPGDQQPADREAGPPVAAVAPPTSVPPAEPSGGATTANPSPEHGPGLLSPSIAARIDPFRHLVDELPDKEIARRARTSPSDVRLYRVKLRMGLLPPATEKAAPNADERTETRDAPDPPSPRPRATRPSARKLKRPAEPEDDAPVAKAEERVNTLHKLIRRRQKDLDRAFERVGAVLTSLDELNAEVTKIEEWLAAVKRGVAPVVATRSVFKPKKKRKRRRKEPLFGLFEEFFGGR